MIGAEDRAPMIVAENLAARRPGAALSGLSVAWGPGLHAVVGSPADGGPLLLALLAGAARPRSGRVRVLDAAPTDRAVRPRVAFVPVDPGLPDAPDVRAIFDLAAALRGESSRCEERLAAVGLGPLSRRRAASLSREERHGVAVAEALTSSVVRVVLLEEPFVGIDPRASSRLPAALAARAREGAAIVVATASVRDAGALGGDALRLRRGVRAGELWPLAWPGPAPPGQGARVRILASDALPLATALAREEAVEAVARHDGTVLARGGDMLALAQAAARAVAASGVNVIEMRIDRSAALDDGAPPVAHPEPS
ncbi:MAG: hypothetical protein JOZ69_17220, partial [Myxococcales bacterium]|nr:hypothetical protein [Myxococcales bacterium]